MTTIACSAVTIQTSAQSAPSTPSWLGEVVIIAHHLTRLGVLALRHHNASSGCKTTTGRG
jgi:hypothetical protein